MTQYLRVVGLLPLLALAGCSQVFYAPNIANAPLLRDRREVRMSGHVGGGDAVDYLVQGTVAASFRSNVGVYGSGYVAGGSRKDSRDRVNSGAGSEWDFGIGYHRFSARRLGLEAIAGVQLGHGSNTSQDAGRVTYHLVKPFIQVNVGYRGRFLEAAFAQRLGRLAYFGIAEDAGGRILPRPDSVNDLFATTPSMLYEPALSVRVGREPIKFGVDISWTHNASGTRLRKDDAAVALSLHYTVRSR